MLKKVKKLRDLPSGHRITNYCEVCGNLMLWLLPSKRYWVTDGTPGGTHGLCSAKCRNKFIKSQEGNV